MGKIAKFIAVGGAIAIVLFLTFSPETSRWVDVAGDYLSRFRQTLKELERGEPTSGETRENPIALPTSSPTLIPGLGPSNPDLTTTKPPVALDKPEIEPPDPNIGVLRNYMLGLINEDRQRHGLATVVLGDNVAAQLHAEDELRNEYFSHWGMDGLTPYMRYTQAGGVNYEAENGFTYGKTGGFLALSPSTCLTEAQKSLMNSPGHRRNILDKWHKKVNLGIAYDRSTCVVAQQFAGDYIEFSQKPTITGGILSFEGVLKGGFTFDGADVWYDQPPHPLTLGQLDATYSYLTGQQPATFLSEPLTGGYYYPDSSTTYTWQSGVDPYSINPDTPRRQTPPPQNMITRSKVVPWTTAQVWEVSGQSFRIEANISSVINELGPGVYTILTWGDSQGESVPLTNYSVFIE